MLILSRTLYDIAMSCPPARWVESVEHHEDGSRTTTYADGSSENVTLIDLLLDA
jgi:hypothetical protein